MTMSCACFLSQAIPHASEIAALGAIFNFFSYDAALGQDSNPSPTRQQSEAIIVEIFLVEVKFK